MIILILIMILIIILNIIKPISECQFDLAPDGASSNIGGGGSDVEILQDGDTTSTITAGDISQLDVKDG